MAQKLTKFQTPTGQTGDVLNPGSWLSMIIGAVVLILTFALGQNLANKIGASVPGVDSNIDRPWSQPKPQVQQNKQPSRVIL
jgi:hypothetical protein